MSSANPSAQAASWLDVGEASRFQPGSMIAIRHDDLQLANWFERGNVLMFELPRRLMLVAAEPGMNRAPQREAYSTDEELRERMPWVFDPLLEPPRRELEPYVELETDRALAACLIWEHRWRCLCDELLAMRAMSGDRPFGGETVSDTLASVLAREPEWSRLPDDLRAMEKTQPQVPRRVNE